MIKNLILIASGKGGVGKSSIAVNLSTSLAKKKKKKVGLLDADIYGPSIPKMLGIYNKPELSKNKKIIPYEKFNIKSMSIGNMLPKETAVIWRGAMASNAIRQLYNDVEWGELDFLFIDLPPGTGDIQLSLCQTLSIKGSIIISTPQEVSLIDVRKAINMFKKVKVPILGMIQNMSYLEIGGKKEFIFGKDGVLNEAKSQNLNFLGEIPIIPKIALSSDEGKPLALGEKNSTSKIFENISEKLIESLISLPKSEVKIES